RFWRAVGVIERNVIDLVAGDAALFVYHAEERALQLAEHAIGRRRAAVRAGVADLDLGRGDTRRVGRAHRAGRQNNGQRTRRRQCETLHAVFPLGVHYERAVYTDPGKWQSPRGAVLEPRVDRRPIWPHQPSSRQPAQDDAMSGPLAGIRILDLTTVQMGPWCTRILADFGADVIKVEAPEGDSSRYTGVPRHRGMSGSFQHNARGKRAIAMDLKLPQARQALLRLVPTVDALASNIRPAALARLGLACASGNAINPPIGYLSMVG